MSGLRRPAVAGTFYEGSREALMASLRECFLHPLGPGSPPQEATDGPRRVAALVSPHAGYMFSGPAAAHGFAALAADGLPDTAVILGPSHYLTGRHASVSLADSWRTPLGDAAVDLELARELLESSPLLEEDERAHASEHSLEVQVPFLQFICGDRMPKICAICVRSHPFGQIAQLAADAKALGESLAQALSHRRALIIASTDFSHHVPQERAERQDRLALEAILALDPEGLLRTVVENEISMCGPVPVAIALYCCLGQGACEAELLRYYTSGDIIGDRQAVVGYASIVIRRTGGEVI